ncbi:hypothetical protein R1flu_021122 [Riccia fluitans]|uniref:Uncharacterized protein n=1 Tax=Riccia fluitans TaxID=41844 RepID=A0ABD1ZNG4_9MARC
MASSSSKARTSSPFRFRNKQPASVNGKLPGLPSNHTPSHSSSSSQAGPSPANRSSSLVGRSLTPSRGRTSVTNTHASSITPQRNRISANSISIASAASPITPTSDRTDFLNRAKENVSVTVRFRPLNAREIQRGDEVAWYADGDTTVRSEYNASTAYAFDRVFGPATTTRGVYDIAAQHVVGGAMEGVNGTVFAYGVTSSGKTHTMHGDQKSPGIIPLAVKDVFSIIQETPSREFLLRVSYLEIYNEVINDLLDPAGQNLRVREDAQGTYVEGIKEEVVLSPAHALSLIAAGEEHRHVGSNNFNLLSSRSHTIFTLTVESSARGEGYNEEDVTLSQLNLIDLAGSESSKTETTGLRRKEGSYINKSLLTLGTVIAKLSEGKASHIPYRDSKLTRLLQSSLSGHGRISLICTITPASSNNEETHNTLKFAHRAKRVEIHAAPNRILDEKSLIKKYQKEISSLKQELEQLKRGILEKPYVVTTSQEDLLSLRQQLEAGHLVKQATMQSRLEEEEQAKAALMGRIQRLTKLILVSTKNTIPHTLLPDKPTQRRRHSFGEEELAYLPDKRRELVHFEEDDEAGGTGDHESGEGKGDNGGLDDHSKEEKKTKKRGMLAWFKRGLRNDNLHVSPATSLDNEHSPIGSPGSVNAAFDPTFNFKGSRRNSISRRVDEMLPVADSFPEPTQAGELFSVTVRGRRPPPTGTTMADQMDLLREQFKMIQGEVALCTSSLKRLSEQAANNPDDAQLQSQMQKLKDEIQEKKRQLKLLEQRIGSADALPSTASPLEMSQTISKLTGQLNEKAFELEIKTADNRILQEQLQTKAAEITEMQDTIHSLRSQLSSALEKKVKKGDSSSLVDNTEEAGGWLNTGGLSGELRIVETGSDAGLPTSGSNSREFIDNESINLQSQILQQAAEIEKLKQERTRWQEEREKLKQEKTRLQEEKNCLQLEGQQLADEAAFARELASRAVVELKNLAEEVTKLSYQNAKLSNDLSTAQELAFAARLSPKLKHTANKECQTDQKALLDIPVIDNDRSMNGLLDNMDRWRLDSQPLLDDIKRELKAAKEKEAALELALIEKERKEAELVKKVNEAKQHETDLENDLAGMWVLVAQLKKEKAMAEAGHDPLQDDSRSKGVDDFLLPSTESNVLKVKDTLEQPGILEDIKLQLEQEKRRAQELETVVLHLKSEELDGLDIDSLYELQNVHVEALTKLCQAKQRQQLKLETERLEKERVEKERERERERELQAKMQLDLVPIKGVEHELHEEERNVCKVCFESPTAAVLLPCRHLCLCKTCADVCTECPLCRSAITARIVTYPS